MDKNNNFYEELKQDIDSHISKNDYAAALKLIEEELSMPYVPRDVEDFLRDKYSEIRSHISQEEKRINIDKIFDILEQDIKSVDKFDLSMTLAEYNLAKYEEDIKKLLLLEEDILQAEVKKNILQLLLDQGNKDK
jgi:hypothetical protein